MEHELAFNHSAPLDERVDALKDLQKSHMPSIADLLPPEPVREVIDQILEMYEEEDLRKSAQIIQFPAVYQKPKKAGMQSVRLDDWNISIQGDYWERPGALNFDVLRGMVDQTPVLSAVILTRIRQVQRFCRVCESNIDMPGFEIRHMDREHKITKSELENIQTINKFVMNCGWEFDARKRKALHRDSFGQFMGRVTRDSLIMDSVSIETEWKRDKSLGIDGIYAVDGGTIRLCTEKGYRGDDAIFALQVVNGIVRTAYTYQDLIYEPRMARSDVRVGGYGLSETELLVRVVTGFLNAMTLNIKGFDSNSIPRGILHLTGSYNDRELNAFKRYWNSMVSGVTNAWKLPVMVSKDQESKVGFERIDVGFNEMFFSKWMTFLTSIICAVYGMSPAEINFDSFSGGNTSPLAGSDTAEKLATSKDSGLRPVMAYFENLFTDYLVTVFNEDFVFRWTGLDPVDQDTRLELKKLITTVDEIRAEEGREALGGVMGNAPVNPSLIGLYMQAVIPQQDGQGGEEKPDNSEESGENQNDESPVEPEFDKPNDETQDSENTGEPSEYKEQELEKSMMSARNWWGY